MRFFDLARRQGHQVFLGTGLELLLLVLVSFQCLRLYRVATEPIIPLRSQLTAPAFGIAGFDPFFRSGTSSPPPPLALTLHGTHERGRAGPGAAIIGLPTGEQRSFTVGVEVLPYVVLTAVGNGEITIRNQGLEQTIHLADYSGAGTGSTPPAPVAQAAQGGSRRGSIDFADPDTLPRSLTAPAPSATGPSTAILNAR